MDKIYGKHSVLALLLQRPEDVQKLLIAGKPDHYADILAEAERAGVTPEFVAWKDLHRVGKFDEDEKHQGVLALARPRPIYSDKDLDLVAGLRRILVLDQVTNPQNLATILRTGAFFGLDAVMLMRNRSVDVSPVVVRYAVGGAEFVHIFRITNVARTLDRLKEFDYFVYGLDERGERTLAETEFAAKSAFVLGAENEGLRPKTKQYCDALVRIDGGRRGLESLNVGIAGAIVLYELVR